MALKRIIAPVAPPVSLAEARLHLRVDATDEDTMITAMINAATEVAEQRMGRAIMPQTWELSLASFPTQFELTRVPVASVTSIKYLDTVGALQTLGAGVYLLDNADDTGLAYVYPAYNASWPAIRSQANAVVLRYVAGYTDAASVPESIKSWIKLQVGAMFENRASTDTKQSYPLGFADRLLDRFVVYQL